MPEPVSSLYGISYLIFPSSPNVIYTFIPKSSSPSLNTHSNLYSPFSLSTSLSPDFPSFSLAAADETLVVFILLPEPV